MLYAAALCCFGAPSAAIVQWFQLRSFRKKQDLEGNDFLDCVKVCCCLHCSLCQTEKEARLSVGIGKKAPGQMDGAVEMEYVRGESMVYGPENKTSGQEAGIVGQQRLDAIAEDEVFVVGDEAYGRTREVRERGTVA